MSTITLNKQQRHRFDANISVSVINAGFGTCQLVIDRPAGTEMFEQQSFRNNIAVPYLNQATFFDFQEGTAYFFGRTKRLLCTGVSEGCASFIFEAANVNEYLK